MSEGSISTIPCEEKKPELIVLLAGRKGVQSQGPASQHGKEVLDTGGPSSPDTWAQNVTLPCWPVGLPVHLRLPQHLALTAGN